MSGYLRYQVLSQLTVKGAAIMQRALDCSARGHSTRARRRGGFHAPFSVTKSRDIGHSTSSSPRVKSKLPSPPSRTTPAPELSEIMLDALLSLSLALYEDEAVDSTAVTLSSTAPVQLNARESSATSESGGATVRTAISAVVESSLSDNGMRADAPPEDAYASVDPDDLMNTVLLMEGSFPKKGEGNKILVEIESSHQRVGELPTTVGGICENERTRDGCGEQGVKSSLRANAALSQVHRTPPAESEGHSTPQASWSSLVSSSPTALEGAIKGPKNGSVSTALAALLTSEEVPLERKIVMLMAAASQHNGNSTLTTHDKARKDFNSNSSSSSIDTSLTGKSGVPNSNSVASASSPLVVASSLLLAGLDMKAVLKHGELSQQHLRHLSLTRCDFSHVRWGGMTVEDCDLSRCIFYQAEWHDVVFRRCDFTGCLMKGVLCSGNVRFDDCEFRLAGMGLQYDEEVKDDIRGGRRSSRTTDEHLCDHHCGQHDHGVRFVRCNFDLSDFQFSNGLSNPAFFSQCSNTDLASRFPLRARGGVN